MNQKPSILIISGTRASGKTTFCTSLSKILRSGGWDVAGLLSLPVIKKGEEIAKDAFDVRSGVRRSLGSVKLHRRATTEVQTGRWTFDAKTIDWCNTIFQSSIPCDFLIIDGPGARLSQGSARPGFRRIHKRSGRYPPPSACSRITAMAGFRSHQDHRYQSCRTTSFSMGSRNDQKYSATQVKIQIHRLCAARLPRQR